MDMVLVLLRYLDNLDVLFVLIHHRFIQQYNLCSSLMHFILVDNVFSLVILMIPKRNDHSLHTHA